MVRRSRVALDLSAARPQTSVHARAAVGGIHLYQATLSPLYARIGVLCRFTPTCSQYGEEVVRRFGVARGGWLATRRVLRCGPWTPMGTMDPPFGMSNSQLMPVARCSGYRSMPEIPRWSSRNLPRRMTCRPKLIHVNLCSL